MSAVEIGMAALVAACLLWARIHHRIRAGRRIGTINVGACIALAAVSLALPIAHYYAHDGLPLLIAVTSTLSYISGRAVEQLLDERARNATKEECRT